MPAPDHLPQPVQQAIDAVNDGDTDGFVHAFAPDGVVDDWGRRFSGRDEIRGWSDRELIGKNSTLSPTDITTDGDTTIVIADVGGDGFNGPSTFTFDINNDHGTKMAITE